jgi:DNA transformation protein
MAATEKAVVAALERKLVPLGPFRARAMFSGYGLYLDGIIFGLVLKSGFYLKVDDGNRAEFRAAGSAPFRYLKRTGEVTIDSYWRCPQAVQDDTGTLQEWVRKAVAASRRIAATRKPRANKSQSAKPRPRRNPFL